MTSAQLFSDQRGFQANSRTVTTADQLCQESVKTFLIADPELDRT